MSNGWGPVSDEPAASNSFSNGFGGRNDNGYDAQRQSSSQGYRSGGDSYRNSPQNGYNSTNQGNSANSWGNSGQNNAPRHWNEPSDAERQEPRYDQPDAPLCQNYLAGRCNVCLSASYAGQRSHLLPPCQNGASCRYRHKLPDSDHIPQMREPDQYSQASNANAVPIGGHGNDSGSGYGSQTRESSNAQSGERSGGWDMPRREPAGWGDPPQPSQQTGGWPEARSQSASYVAPVDLQRGSAPSSGGSALGQGQYSGRPIADNSAPDGGRGWGEERRSSRFSAPVEDRYSQDAQKLQSQSASSNAGASGWQTISSDEHEARSAVSRKSSRFQPPNPLPSHSEVPPLPDLPIAKQAPAPAGQSGGAHRQEDQHVPSRDSYQDQPPATAVSADMPGRQMSSSGGMPQPISRPQSAISRQSQPTQSSFAEATPRIAETQQMEPAAGPSSSESSVRSASLDPSRPQIDEVWILKDHNAVRNNMWSPTLRSPRISSGRNSIAAGSGQNLLVSLDEYTQSSDARAEADRVADSGDDRENAQVVPTSGDSRQMDQSFAASIAGASVRPSESASNVGAASSEADEDDRSTMRSPSRSMHGPPAIGGRKYRTFNASNEGSETGESSPAGGFDDNPNAMTTGWSTAPIKPAAAPRKPEPEISRAVEPPSQSPPKEAQHGPQQQYNNGWRAANSLNQRGWFSPAPQAPLPAPTPRQSSSHGTVNELERAATPRATRSSESNMSRNSTHQRDRSFETAASQPQAALPPISIKGASKYHAESVDLKGQLAEAQMKITNLERRVNLSQEEAENERVLMLLAENKRLKERIATLESERSAVKAALVPALKILSTPSPAVKRSSSAVSTNGHGLQNGRSATPVKIKQETPPLGNGWNA